MRNLAFKLEATFMGLTVLCLVFTIPGILPASIWRYAPAGALVFFILFIACVIWNVWTD